MVFPKKKIVKSRRTHCPSLTWPLMTSLACGRWDRADSDKPITTTNYYLALRMIFLNTFYFAYTTQIFKQYTCTGDGK